MGGEAFVVLLEVTIAPDAGSKVCEPDSVEVTPMLTVLVDVVVAVPRI